MKKYISHITEITIIPEGEPIFSEEGYVISIRDEAAGPFIVIHDNSDNQQPRLGVDLEVWPQIKDAANKLIKICKKIKSPA